jgi:hypothetical protein
VSVFEKKKLTLSHSSSLIESKSFHSLNLVHPYNDLAPRPPNPKYPKYTYRVCKNDIHAAQLLDRFLNRAFGFSSRRHVCSDHHSLDARLLARFCYLLRRLDAVKVVDGNVASFFCKSGAEEFAEAAIRSLA